MKCCNNVLKLLDRQTDEHGKIFFYKCDSCGRQGWGKNKAAAEKMFNESKPKTQPPTVQNTALAKMPADRKLINAWAANNMLVLMSQSAQFIDKPATSRMIEKNIRYVANLQGKTWDKIWSTEEGQESISYALSESLYYGATLPEMGSIVPFGNTAEFVPSVECFEFAMKTGKNAPFSEIKIIPIHENDTRKVYQKDENFTVELEYGIPRGEIIAVAVQARRTDTQKYVGELYDVERLLEKAAEHSPSYRQYLNDKADFDKLRVEGKLKEENGRKYMEKKFSNWTKKIFEHDIINPYAGADRPEMMRKSAGKTFFRPFMKVRNASAMADEWNEDETLKDDATRDEAADHVLKQAAGQFETGSENIVDAEIIPPEDPNTKKEPMKEKEVEKKSPPVDDTEIEGL